MKMIACVLFVRRQLYVASSRAWNNNIIAVFIK